MFFVTVAIMLAGGVLGAASLIVAKKPDAKVLIDKLAPYQGSIGALMFIWGIWDTISVVRLLSLLSLAPVYWIIFCVTAVTELFLGFLLGFSLIAKYALSKNAAAMEKGEQLRLKLAKFQGPLGIVAILLGILFLVGRFVFF